MPAINCPTCKFKYVLKALQLLMLPIVQNQFRIAFVLFKNSGLEERRVRAESPLLQIADQSQLQFKFNILEVLMRVEDSHG